MSKCTNCGEHDAEVYPSPKDYVGGRSITLFGWTIILYREKSETVDDLCSNCLVDRQQSNEADRMESVLDEVYTRGYEDGQRGKL